MKRALLKVGYRCNNNCVFCHSYYLRSIPPCTTEQLYEKIELCASTGHDMVILSGGEPMIRSDLLDIAAKVNKLGMKLGLVTNGRMLFYRDLLDRLLDTGLSYVYISLHGGDRVTHNFLTGADSFRQTISGIINSSRSGLHPTINTVVCRRNIGELRTIVDLLCGISHLKVKFSLIEPKGLAKESFTQVVPGLRDTALAISDAISYGLDRYGGRDVDFAFDTMPMCQIIEYAAFYDDLYTNSIFSMSEADEKGLHPVDTMNRGWSLRCLQCSLRGFCLGVFTEYLSHAGDRDLQPVIEQRPNQFLMRQSGLPVKLPLTNCFPTAMSLCDDLSIFVDAGKAGVAPWRADTKDFSAPQVLETLKNRQVQGVKGKKLVTLKPVEKCLKCARCNGVYREAKAPDANFNALDKAISGLKGKILDIGCGDVSFWKKLQPMVSAGKIQYHALDPDPARIDMLTRRSRQVVAHISRIEDFLVEPDTFDACLMLGSINHVQELDTAVTKIKAVLKPGGQLIISDDVPSAIVSEETPAGDSGYEHYRNLSSGSVVELLKSAGFTVNKEHPVTTATEGRWVILAKKG